MTADEIAIREILPEWFTATKNRDLPTILSLMTDDVVFLTPGQPPFGKETFAANFQAGTTQVQINPVGEFEEVIVAGEVAYARGRLTVTIKNIDGATLKTLSGYTLTVLRKQEGGRWLIARDANLLAPVQER